MAKDKAAARKKTQPLKNYIELGMSHETAHSLVSMLISGGIAACNVASEYEIPLLISLEIADSLSLRIARSYRTFDMIKLRLNVSQAFALHKVLSEVVPNEGLARGILTTLDPWVVLQRGTRRTAFEKELAQAKLKKP